MSESATPSPSEPSSDENGSQLSLKKLGDMLIGFVQIQRNVEKLQKDNARLQAQVDRLQRICDDQSGQLKVIMRLIESTVNERAVRNSEEASLRLVQQYLALRFGDKTNEK
jgi:hypothetical protein